MACLRTPHDWWYIYGCIALEAKTRSGHRGLTKCLSLPEDPGRPKMDREAKESARTELAKYKN